MKKHIIATLVLLIPLFTTKVQAEPWVDTSDIFLRADIQLLADRGLLNIPTTSYPLMWADVSRAMRSIAPEQLTGDDVKSAYWHINQHMRRADNNQRKVALSLATDDRRFKSFGDAYFDANKGSVSYSFMGERVAGKFNATLVNDPLDEDDVRLDGSYLTAFWGNWVFSAGQIDRWWGPQWDSSLVLTNNARPMPSISISRKTSAPFTVPFTEYQIPWNVSTFMGQFEQERFVPNAILWGFRANAKLTPKLEVTLSRLAQWNGDGRPDGFDTFFDIFLGRDNCVEAGFSCGGPDEPGNQLAGYDMRYARPFDLPFSLYYQKWAEDGKEGSLNFISKSVKSYGIDTRLAFFEHQWLAYADYTDTQLDCSSFGPPTSCLYEHHIYRTGMRYKQRNLGHLYENDATSLVFGLVSQLSGLSSWEFKLRVLELNTDNGDLYPNIENGGNTLTAIAEDMLMLSGKYQQRFGKFTFTFGGDISQSTFLDDIDDETNGNIYIDINYVL